jgi:probable phosphoglycerate mutase
VNPDGEFVAGAPGPIWLVRHAPTDWTGVRWCGRSDPSLTPAGREAAERVAAEIAADLAGRRSTGVVILSSPLRRALQSAAPIARTIGSAAVNVEPDLAEVDFGTVDGVTWDELVLAQPTLSEAILAGAKPDWPGGETAAEVASRARSAADRILRAAEAGSVVVVSHGRLLREIAAHLSPVDIAAWSFEPASARRLDPLAGLWIPATNMCPLGVG